MKFGVIIFPGSNCDQDMIHVLKNVLKADVKILWHKEKELEGFNQEEDCIVLPGGFSYGDYLRSGAIARFSPIMDAVIEFANSGGLVFGVCNGFQVLCESGLLPGALVRNKNQKFICKNVFIKPQTNNTRLTSQVLLDRALKIPIAHAEGRYVVDERELESMRKYDQVLFKYCNEDGVVDELFNPNGSMDNIAGICNKGRNVFGMMPHPERASEEALGNNDGLVLFKSLVTNVMQPV